MMRKRRTRWRRLKWVMLGVSVLTLLAMVQGIWWTESIRISRVTAIISGGGFCVLNAGSSRVIYPSRVEAEIRELPAEFQWMPIWRTYGSEFRAVAVPLWPFVLLFTAATVVFFRLDRPEPGACRKCRYPREGLAAEAACPECGLPPTRAGNDGPVAIIP